MQRLLNAVKKVIRVLEANNVPFSVDEDNLGDSLEYEEVEGHEIIVADDHCKQTWSTEIKVENVDHDALTTLLIEALGPQSKTHVRTDKVKVNNWEPSKKVLVVHAGDSVDFIQYYDKR